MAGKKKKDSKAKVEAKVNSERNVSGTVDEFADCVVTQPGLIAQLEALGFKSKNPNGMTFKEAMICSQIASAVKGDTKAYRAIMDYADRKNSKPLKKYIDGNDIKLPMADLIE